MTPAVVRTAVSPVRRRVEALTRPLQTVDEIVAAERPADPLHCLRPNELARSARHFVRAFPGKTLYAVKCNPDPRVLRGLWAGGVRHFDCASLPEITLVRQLLPGARIHFMHPVKSRTAIAEAFTRWGVTDFVLDSRDELRKILTETGATGRRLGLFVRLAVPNTGAVYDLSAKFGASIDEAAALLAAARPMTARLGICFHVGSQCLVPQAYADALGAVAATIGKAGVKIDVIDVGGGFPVSYADVTPPPLEHFIDAIEGGLLQMGLRGAAQLWAEPGRFLVAGGGSVVVQINLRRGRDLYINDGVYGSLFDAGQSSAFRFPVRLIRPDGRAPASETLPFRLFGPTCDSADRMDGPFMLPADSGEGDWIEIGQLGAYGACLRTAFNGFDRARLVEVRDRPLLSGGQQQRLSALRNDE